MIALIGAPYDHSCTGPSGSRVAPEKIREMSFFMGLYEGIHAEFADVTTGEIVRLPSPDDIADLGDANVYPLDWPATERSLRTAIGEILERGALPVVLGGDHFVSFPLAVGFAEALRSRGRTPGYIQLSSSLDLGTEDPVWGSIWRGATARRILDSGAIAARRMAWVGPHGYVPRDQWRFAQERELRIFPLREVRQLGSAETIRRALEWVGADATVYVSVDLDVLDGTYGNIADQVRFDGLTPAEVQDAVRTLSSGNVGAWDFVGLNSLRNPTPYPRHCEHLVSTLVLILTMAARERRAQGGASG